MRRVWMRRGAGVAPLVACFVCCVCLSAGTATLDEALLFSSDGSFVATAQSPVGGLVNPAGLIALQDVRLRVQGVGEDIDSLNSVTLVYAEPDRGIGAGAVTYQRRTQAHGESEVFLYSVAKRLGERAAYGVSIHYLQSATHKGLWGVDLGLRRDLAHGLRLGLAVHNVWRSSEAPPNAASPRQVVLGVALARPSFVVAADWLDPDLDAAAHEPLIRLGIEIPIGPVRVRAGRRLQAGGAGWTDLGIGVRVGAYAFDGAAAERPKGDLAVRLGLGRTF